MMERFACVLAQLIWPFCFTLGSHTVPFHTYNLGSWINGFQQIYEDNQGLLKIAENMQALDRCHHVSRQANSLHQSIQHKIMSLNYITSKENLADIFMKAVHHSELNQVIVNYLDSGHQNKGE